MSDQNSRPPFGMSRSTPTRITLPPALGKSSVRISGMIEPIRHWGKSSSRVASRPHLSLTKVKSSSTAGVLSETMLVTSRPARKTGHPGIAWLPPLPLFLIQPLLRRIVQRIAADIPSVFDRLGPHRTARFVIDAHGLPFILLLRPDPENLLFRAFPRDAEPDHDARISGKFFDLLALVDGEQDGDALFFSRDLDVGGNTEAVVCLRNALDDVDGSIAARVADMFGPPGRAALAALRRAGRRPKAKRGEV